MTALPPPDLEHGASGFSLRQRAVRFLCVFAVWVALGRVGPVDLLAGALGSALVAELSLRLLPPSRRVLRVRPIAIFLAHFLRRSAFAGVDLLRRVTAPVLPIAPGIVAVDCGMPEGLLRQGFAATISLQPGTLPCGAEEDALLLHALDVEGPVLDELEEDATLYLEAMGTAADEALPPDGLPEPEGSAHG